MKITALTVLLSLLFAGSCCEGLEAEFASPPDSSRPGVYWYFMDGNISREAITKDLESMKEAGIGYLIYMEVNLGIPRGRVDFLSDRWQDMFAHAVAECERLGIDIILGVGPGWAGSGGPWVGEEQSMQHLVFSSVELSGPGRRSVLLPVPAPMEPFFTEDNFTPEARARWAGFYRDVVVLAFPAGVATFGTAPEPGTKFRQVTGIEEKALYYRRPYSSAPEVKQYLTFSEGEVNEIALDPDRIVDLTVNLAPDGTLRWDVPPGRWTIMRFGVRSNGAVTRPAPLPGVGLESDKFDTLALAAHIDKFVGKLMRRVGFEGICTAKRGGLRMLHVDSWEMGAQNWSGHFREEFTRRRGYDPQPWYPVYAGMVVGSRMESERFLWDLRLTSLELIRENHVGWLRTYARRHGMELSIEPYDMNPAADLELAAVADMPMAEFWSVGYGYNTSYSVVEASSVAHLLGQKVVPAEAFTSWLDGWQHYPSSMKNQTDWALAAGINRLIYHTFQHQSLPDSLRPGMTMGPYGVHWDRNQTWWPMAHAYHSYVARAQFLLQQGRTVADILYLTPEGAPHVFLAPDSAFEGELLDAGKGLNFRTTTPLPDRRGYNFDASPPSLLHTATVEDGRIVFPSGASYRLLVLPCFETMTPELLGKIRDLVKEGATMVGLPPAASPSLTSYPSCDEDVRRIRRELWGEGDVPREIETREIGLGRVIWGMELRDRQDNLYPDYAFTANVLKSMDIPADFSSTGPVRYTHRTAEGLDIYFVSNRTERPVETVCRFRVTGSPELWDPINGQTRPLPEYTARDGQTVVPLEFDSNEGYFIVFRSRRKGGAVDRSRKIPAATNFATYRVAGEVAAPWEVSFSPAWGGPSHTIFDTLTDWTKNADPDIRYYSGTAVYSRKFDKPLGTNERLVLDLGRVKNMARVRLNDHNLGVVWTSPWRVDITEAVKDKNNELNIEVVNLWPNRLIGDESLPDDGIVNGEWPEWLTSGGARTSRRYTFTTYRHFRKDSPLLESGLLGPVTIQEEIPFGKL